jgi:uncharacterized protein (DUF2249 family)
MSDAAPLPRGLATELDVRGIAPPEPMALILDALDQLGADARLHVRIDREPLPLFRILAGHGYSHRCEACADGGYALTIWLPARQQTGA